MSSNINERRRNIAKGINIADSKDIRASARAALSESSESSHARDDALSPRNFEQLISASHEIESNTTELECRTLLYLTGRLGLRKGEVAHLDENWIDWNDRTLTIPEHDRCTKGKKNGEVCGYCRRRAKDRVEANNITKSEALEAIKHALNDVEADAVENSNLEAEAKSLKEEVNITMEKALNKQWQPKTSNSARRVPFDFDVRVELVVEEFFDKYNEWPTSASTINRRINRVVNLSSVNSRVYPHALRATAASYHASRDISVHSLMSTMGWADPSTARAYITANADQAAKEIRSKHR